MVRRVLWIADQLKAASAAAAPAQMKPARVRITKHTVIERPEPQDHSPAKLALEVRPDSLSSPEGGSVVAGIPETSEPPESVRKSDVAPARESAPERVIAAPVADVARVEPRRQVYSAPRRAAALAPIFTPSVKSKHPAPIAAPPVTQAVERPATRAVGFGWVEQRMASVSGAIAFLGSKGFHVTRLGGDRDLIARYHISSYSGEWSQHQLLDFAKASGFAG
jgi:hypothetical protein